jgi:hypothetical protein
MSLETLSNRNASLFFVSALDRIVVRRDQTYPFNKTTTAEERSDLTIYGDWNPMIKSFETSRAYSERHEDYLGFSLI